MVTYLTVHRGWTRMATHGYSIERTALPIHQSHQTIYGYKSI